MDPSTPVILGQKIRRGNTRAFWVYPHKMGSTVLDEIKRAIALKHLVGRAFREREHVFRCVVFLLVDPTAFNANSIHEQRK